MDLIRRKCSAGVIFQISSPTFYSHNFPLILERINIIQGVKQDRVLSPLLYSLYVNDLLVELESLGLGARLGNVYTGAPMYADDLALIATYPEELQSWTLLEL